MSTGQEEAALERCIENELAVANSQIIGGQYEAAFHHLERAHILGQDKTYQQVRVRWRMLG